MTAEQANGVVGPRGVAPVAQREAQRMTRGVKGGGPPRSPYERLMDKVTIDPATGCWIFHGSRQKYGHGLIRVGSKSDGTSRLVKAHRVSYEHHRGPIPDGLALDHLCKNPPCVNPEHLDPCTQKENMQREAHRRTQCRNGHPWVASVRAISLHAPWATLITLGVKKVETRSWPCPSTLIGQPIALHQTKRVPTPERGPMFMGDFHIAQGGTWLHGPSVDVLMPFGCIVGSAVVTACVQILKIRDDGSWTVKRMNGEAHVPGVVLDQLVYGDFAPGRYAWLLDDAASTTERCPWCRGDGGDPDSYESLVIGAPEVATRACPICGGAGHCDPVPAKGKQRIWEWSI